MNNPEDQASSETRFGFSRAVSSCPIQVNGEIVPAYLLGNEWAYEKERTYAGSPRWGSQVRLSTKLCNRYRRDFDFPNELVYKQDGDRPKQVLLVRLRLGPGRNNNVLFEQELAVVLEYFDPQEVLQDEKNTVYIVVPYSEVTSRLVFQKYFSSTAAVVLDTYPPGTVLANEFHVRARIAKINMRARRRCLLRQAEPPRQEDTQEEVHLARLDESEKVESFPGFTLCSLTTVLLFFGIMACVVIHYYRLKDPAEELYALVQEEESIICKPKWWCHLTLPVSSLRL